jgi:hypothetical protein
MCVTVHKNTSVTRNVMAVVVVVVVGMIWYTVGIGSGNGMGGKKVGKSLTRESIREG